MNTNKKLDILIVDDDEAIRDLIEECLLDFNHKIIKAENSSEAIDILMSQHFDLVITDIRMPFMSGLKLTEKIKENYPDTYVVIITSYATKDNALLALKLGAYDYLEKPFQKLEKISYTVQKIANEIAIKKEKDQYVVDLKKTNEELARKNNLLRDVAIHDALTGIYNRNFLDIALSREFNRAKRYNRDLSILFVDIDHFKILNDNYGHQIGDKILKSSAKIVSENTRKSDITFRYGGEEFVVVLPETDPKNAYKVAEKIRNAISEHTFTIPSSNIIIKITASLGVASYQNDMESNQILLERADKALYKAKQSGRNITKILG